MTIEVIVKKEPEDIDVYLRALANAVLLVKIAFDIIKILTGYLV